MEITLTTVADPKHGGVMSKFQDALGAVLQTRRGLVHGWSSCGLNYEPDINAGNRLTVPQFKPFGYRVSLTFHVYGQPDKYCS